MRFMIYIITLLVFITCNSTVYAAEVVMVKWLDENAMDDAFEKRLKKLYPETSFRYIRSHRDSSLLLHRLKHYNFARTKLIYTFGTTCTQIVKKFLNGRKPIVFNGVSAPVLSKIVNALEKPDRNITGAKLLVEIEVQMELLTKLKKIKKLAVWFDPREKHSANVLEKIANIAKDKNITVYPFRMIPDASYFDNMLEDVSRKTNKMDALYFITSASFHLNYHRLHSKLSPSLLMMGPTRHYVEHGSSIVLGPDIIERSHTLAEMATRILKGEKVEDIPVSTVSVDKAIIFINRERMESAGLGNVEIPNLKTVSVKKD